MKERKNGPTGRPKAWSDALVRRGPAFRRDDPEVEGQRRRQADLKAGVGTDRARSLGLAEFLIGGARELAIAERRELERRRIDPAPEPIFWRRRRRRSAALW